MTGPEDRSPDRRVADRPHAIFGALLKAARIRRKHTRSVLAKEVGVSQQMLFYVENGQRRASDELIAKLAPKLGLHADRMITVRNAIEVDRRSMHGRTSEIQKFMARERDTLAEAHPIAYADQIILDIGSSDDPVLDQLIQDLHELSESELSQVRGYVDHLLEGRQSRKPVKRLKSAARTASTPPSLRAPRPRGS